MKIFLTGATGFIGKKLVSRLYDLGNQITILVRKTSNLDFFSGLNVKIEYGDLTDEASLERGIKDQEIVIHLAGVIHPINVDNKFYFDHNVKATENIARLCLKYGIKQMIYCSSVTCYGKVKDPNVPISENYPCYGQNIYGKTKYLGELAVENVLKSSNIDYTIIRPARVYGPGDYTLLPLFKLIKKRIFFIVGDGLSYMQPIYIDDLVDLFVNSIMNPAAYGKKYNAAGENFITKKKFMKMAAVGLGVKLNRPHIPLAIAVMAARLSEFVFLNFLKKEPPVSRKKLKFFIMSRKYNINQAKKDLNFNPKYTIEDGLKETIQWCKIKKLI